MPDFRLPLGLPVIGLHIRLDALSAFFGLIVNLGVLTTAIYGLGLDRDRDLSARVEPFFPAYALAMNLVLIAGDAFGFLFSWELMSLTSWMLVVSRHRDAESRHAGHVYLVMAAIGTASLLFAFGGLAGAAGNYAFDAIRAAPPGPLVSGSFLRGAIFGAGSKAGIAPLHAWLPLAHPAAPSHVSALMSGVMTKVAIYGLIRIVFDLLGTPVWWWALPFLLLGAATAVLGLLYAVLDQDLKRVLAYSTVENIGIIFVGLGLALAFKASGLAAAAAVAMAATLLHCLNHSWFKSLLFLGAGAVLHATGRRDFDGLGGLIHRMPVTAAFWLVGAMSISALPPFNGFVSEWLLFQAVLAGPAFPEPILRFMSPAVGAMLALAAALAAACFVRAFGIVYLGRPRSKEAAEAHETARPQQVAMALLAGLCLLGGLFGGVTISAIQPLLQAFAGVPLPAARHRPHALLARRLRCGAQHLRCADDCALPARLRPAGNTAGASPLGPANQAWPRMGLWISGSFAAHAIQRVELFAALAAGLRWGGLSAHPKPSTCRNPATTAPARLTVRLHDYAWELLYAAPARAVVSLSERLNTLQFLTIRRYLMLVFSALIVLLLIAAVWF